MATRRQLSSHCLVLSSRAPCPKMCCVISHISPQGKNPIMKLLWATLYVAFPFRGSQGTLAHRRHLEVLGSRILFKTPSHLYPITTPCFQVIIMFLRLQWNILCASHHSKRFTCFNSCSHHNSPVNILRSQGTEQLLRHAADERASPALASAPHPKPPTKHTLDDAALDHCS